MEQLDEVLTLELTAVIPHLRRWAARFETREYDADSLVSDTIISFLERPFRYAPGRGSLRNFLFTSLKNKSVDFYKSYNRDYRKKFRLYLRHEARTYVDSDPGESILECDLLVEIDRRLEVLPKKLSEAFRLFAFENKDYAQIAQALETSYANVKSMVHRARIKLREHLLSA